MQVPEEKINALLVTFVDRTLFSEAELAALELADRMAWSGHAVDDALWQELRRHFSEAEIIELVCVNGLFNYFNRVNDAIKTDITK